MADKKISQLTGATTPLAGTEVLPVVQSSTTKKVAVSDLTAGRNVAVANLDIQGTGYASRYIKIESNTADPAYNTTITDQINNGLLINKVEAGFLTTTVFLHDGNLTLSSAGNFVVGTAGKGIDFSANTHAAGMTSELLDWYEEGTWTPVADASDSITGTWTASNAKYTRIGRMVFCEVSFTGTGIGFSSSNGYYKWTGLPFTQVGKVNGTWSSDIVYAPVAGHITDGGAGAIFIYAAQNTTGASIINASFSYSV